MQYFKHQANMRNDLKIKRVISKFGLEGYGLYNLIIESITESLSTDSPLPDLQENCEDIAEFYNGNTAKVNEMMSFMINQGLFDIDEITGAILCNKVYKFLDTSQTRSEKLRLMISNYKASTKRLELENHGMSQDVSDGHRQNETSNDKSEELELEKKKNIELEKNNKEGNKSSKPKKHKYGEYRHVLLTTDQYDKLVMDFYGPEKVDDMIKNLDEYIETTGKAYKNHNLVMRKWEQNKPTAKKVDSEPMPEVLKNIWK